MSDMEKVIKGLECCLALKDNFCDNCPYSLNEWECDKEQLKKDALALLKAQETRVMTLDEIRNAKTEPMWRETKSRHKDMYDGWVLKYEVQKGMGILRKHMGTVEPSGHTYWYKLDDYGRTWRCWTAVPTDEQREAVKWE